jgi:hypothetical protein
VPARRVRGSGDSIRSVATTALGMWVMPLRRNVRSSSRTRRFTLMSVPAQGGAATDAQNNVFGVEVPDVG